MVDNIIRMAIPLFLIGIGVELFLSKRGRRDLYRFPDTFANLSCGVLQQVGGLAVKVLFIFLYEGVYRSYSIQSLWGITEWPLTWWFWVGSFIVVDLFYYWFHRLSHEVNFLWAAHVVHHQSEEYNLAVALRQGAFQNIFNFIFFLPLALIGIPTVVVAVCYSVNLVYQFWIHTRLIGKMGLFEAVMNTPSHHRVHHGVNPIYIDKNHAGTFIVWDRLFGTFENESEAVVFGITVPVRSWNPVWSHVQPYISLFSEAAKAPKWGDKLRYLIAQPGWRPQELGGPVELKAVSRETQVKYDTPVTSKMYYYVLLQFLILTGLSLMLEPLVTNAQLVLAIGLGAFVVVGLGALAGLMENKRWAPSVEVIRHLALVGFVLVHGIG